MGRCRGRKAGQEGGGRRVAGGKRDGNTRSWKAKESGMQKYFPQLEAAVPGTWILVENGRREKGNEV